MLKYFKYEVYDLVVSASYKSEQTKSTRHKESRHGEALFTASRSPAGSTRIEVKSILSKRSEEINQERKRIDVRYERRAKRVVPVRSNGMIRFKRFILFKSIIGIGLETGI